MAECTVGCGVCNAEREREGEREREREREGGNLIGCSFELDSEAAIS